MSYRKNVRARAGELHPVEAFREMPDYLRGALLWIKRSMVPASSVQQDCTSYCLSLDAEEEIGVYIPNDAFKSAMLASGYEPADGNALNWHFRIRRRHWRRTSGYIDFTLDRQHLTLFEAALFDFVASWAQMRELADLQNRRNARGQGYSTPPIWTDEDRTVFSWVTRLGVVGEHISPRVYAAVMGSYEGPGGRQSRCRSSEIGGREG
jgi:hypothetical protein